MQPVATIVYDSEHPSAKANRCFEQSFRGKGPGHDFTVELSSEGQRLGYLFVTVDIFLESPTKFTNPLLITDMVSANTDRAIANGAHPFLCYSFESPLIARRFYMNIASLAGRFVHNWQFGGTEGRLKFTATRFQTMRFPVSHRDSLDSMDWNDRKLLCIINSNKRVYRTDYTSLASSARSFFSRALYEGQRFIDPWIRSREIYTERVEAIKYYSDLDLIDLYGLGWDRPIPGFSASYSSAAKKAYKGLMEYDKKVQLLSKYKFCICFENCVFPGYVTEKIFDALLAGCIPIYFGAPDIEDFVPENVFVDYRKFNDWKALTDYITGMPYDKARQMLDNARAYLKSEGFDRHYLPKRVTEIFGDIQLFLNKNLTK